MTWTRPTEPTPRGRGCVTLANRRTDDLDGHEEPRSEAQRDSLGRSGAVEEFEPDDRGGEGGGTSALEDEVVHLGLGHERSERVGRRLREESRSHTTDSTAAFRRRMI